LVTCGSDDVGRLWNRRADGQGWEVGPVLQCGGDVISAAIRPDGKALITTARPGNIQFWDLPDGRSCGQITLRTMPWRLAYSPDGRRFAAGSWDRSVNVWDVSSATPQDPARLIGVLLGHSQLVLNEAFDESGSLLASASNDGSLRIWDLSAPTGGNDDPKQADRRRCLISLEAPAGDSLSVAFLPREASGNHKLEAAVGYMDGTVRVWDLEYFDRHLNGQSDFQRGIRTARSTRPQP
jgi:WD40 repeat protein